MESKTLTKQTNGGEWKQTVIAYYWLSIWKAVTELTQGDFDPTTEERDDHMGFMLGHLFCHIPAMNNCIQKTAIFHVPPKLEM